MSRRRLRLLWLGAAALLPTALLPPPAPWPQDPAPAGTGDDASCRICHPGPTKALATTPHAVLLTREPARACTACHGDLSAHAAAPAAARPRAGAVAPAACAACHAGRDLAPAIAAHAWRRLEPAATPRSAPWSPTVLPEPAADPFGLEWSAMAAFGVRFVDRWGSRERYDTDIDLDPGFRLMEAEIEGTGKNDSLLPDRVHLAANDIGDPWQRVSGRVDKPGWYRGDASFEKSVNKYRAAGDFHRVDRKHEQTDLALSIDVTDDVELFGSFGRRHDDGYWLTNRIGNRNVTPLTTITGVRSPREFDGDTMDAGVSGDVLGLRGTVAVEYRDDSERERWQYAQPAPLNPAFPQSEDFLSQSSLRGPGARAALNGDFGDLSLSFSGRVLDLDRRIYGTGEQRGYDIGEFVTTTNATAAGSARTWLLDGTATLGLLPSTDLILDLRWIDHRERLDIDQTDLTVYPTLGSSAVVNTALAQETVQRQFEGSIQLDVEPWEGVLFSGGYGWSREWLRVPDLESGDPDFSRGELRNDGVILGAQWRPDAHWVVDARYRDYGQNGVQLHELTEDRARSAEGRVRYGTRQWSLDLFGQNRSRRNDVSSTSSDVFSTGAVATLTPSDDLDLHAGYTFADLDTSTLTNFYFDPDPNPVPTLVGFDGITHTWHVGLTARPEHAVRWRIDGAYTETSGSFDVRMFDGRTDVSVEVLPGGEAGVLFRYVTYDEAGSVDDYGAALTFVYWRQRLGVAR